MRSKLTRSAEAGLKTQKPKRAKAPGRQRQIGPEPVDIHVAMRVRQRRIELGISQQKLAAALGVTFQQIYKYEKAKTRMSAARLYGVSRRSACQSHSFLTASTGPIQRRRSRSAPT